MAGSVRDLYVQILLGISFACTACPTYAADPVEAPVPSLREDDPAVVDPETAPGRGDSDQAGELGDAAGRAQGDDLFALDLEDLGSLEVSTGPSLSNAPSSVLDASTTDFSDAETTGELLEQAASVTVRRTSAINLDARVRGYHSEQISANANGMTQLKTRIDIDSLFSQIDPGIIDRIEVIDGPYSSLYGPAFAFFIADLYASPRYEHGPEMHGTTFLTYGSNGRTLYTRQNVWGGGRDWGAYASYGLRLGNDYDTGSGSEFLVPASFKKWDGFFSVSRDVTAGSRIEFNYVRTEINDLELPGVVYDIGNSHNDQFNIRYVVQEDPDGPEQFVVQYWLHQTAYYGDASRESKQRTLYRSFFSLPAFDEFPVNTVGDGRSDSMGLRSLLTLGEVETGQWTTGVDWRRYSQVYRELNLDADGELVFDGNVFGIPKSQRDDVGVFTHLLLPLREDVTCTLGGRLDWSTNNIDSNDPVVTAFSGDPDDYFFDPGLEEPSELLGMGYGTARFQLPNHFVLSGGAAYAMRNPSLAELYSDEPYVPLVRLGNSYIDGQSNLDPERNWQFDLGLAYTGKNLAYGVRGFYSEVQDYITPAPAYIDPSAPDFIDGGHNLGRDFTYFPDRTDLGTANENADTNQAGYIYTNIDRATISGVDFFADVHLHTWLATGGRLAYVEGTNHAPVAALWDADDNLIFVPTVGKEPLRAIYPFHGTVWVRVFDPQEDRWSLEFSARMVAQQDRVAFTLSEIPTPGFAVFDLRGHYLLRDDFRLTLGIKNLLDRTYSEHGSLAILNRRGQAVFLKEPGITVLVGGEWRF